jgi:uncharacterized NAD(P)/FAD-binding protein YdhS
MVNILVIGTGGAGIGFLKGLESGMPKSSSFASGINITVIEKEDSVKGGTPYSDTSNYTSSLINMPLEEMCIPSSTSSSREFMTEKLGFYGEYPKRTEFGKYLQEEFGGIVSDLSLKGVKIDIRTGEEVV